MLYKRSSFLTLLKTKYDCELIPLNDGKTIKIVNGPANTYIQQNSLDRIDYEEIYIHYKKLALLDLPSSSDLQPADEEIPSKKHKKK